MFDFGRIFPRRKRRLVILGIIGLLIIVIGSCAMASFIKPSHSSTQQGRVSTVPAATSGASSISPLIFGSNLGPLEKSNQVLTSTQAYQMVQQLHIRMLRIPTRSMTSMDLLLQAAHIVKNLGASPLVVLPGPTDPQALDDDKHILTLMNTVFEQARIYYEYDDEVDVLGVSAENYTKSWNAVIPQLKQLAPHSSFIGPVNYQYNQSYISTFLQGAQPGPDAISWHEYTCSDEWSQELCLANIAHWSTHVADARSTMSKLLGKELPVLITEWNYAANPAPDDGKNNDSTFMVNWTKQAMQTLIANHVFAAMQYTCADTLTPLIGSDGQLTPQGKTFQQLYETFAKGTVLPTPSSTVTASAATPTVDTSSSNNPGAQPTLVPSSNPPAQPTPVPTTAPQPTPVPPTPTPTPRTISVSYVICGDQVTLKGTWNAVSGNGSYTGNNCSGKFYWGWDQSYHQAFWTWSNMSLPNGSCQAFVHIPSWYSGAPEAHYTLTVQSDTYSNSITFNNINQNNYYNVWVPLTSSQGNSWTANANQGSHSSGKTTIILTLTNGGANNWYLGADAARIDCQYTQ